MKFLPQPFVIALLVLGIAVSITVVPGVFTTDDNNYLINIIALRQGRFTVGNTEGLSPSRELLAFDPGPWERRVTSTPVASAAPPLYALLALPFSWLEWRGLVGLNTLAYLATIAMVFLYSRRYATEASTAWIAAAAFALGGFVIEYAQGVWPHALSIALCTGGIFAAGRVIDSSDSPRPYVAAAAGFLLALATGVRYQNVIILASVAGAIAWWSPRRWRTLTAFVLGALLPLAASAGINHVRLGSWDPISKGDGYLTVPLAQGAFGGTTALFDPLVMFWARVVDFSVRPPLLGFFWVTYDPVTGAHLMGGETLQKAFLQSAPWAGLAFLIFISAWIPGFEVPQLRRRQIRLLSLVTFAVFVVFALSGRQRHEGLSFNQRYLLETLPLTAIAFAWALDGLKVALRPLLVGSLWGAMVVLVVLFSLPVIAGPHAKQLALLKAPLIFSTALGVLWLVARSREHVRPALAAMAGLCLGWAMMLHLADDLQASRQLRTTKMAEMQALDGVLPDGSALVAYSGYKDAAFPLLFHRDIVILDARGDEGVDAPRLIRELLDRGRRVFLLGSGFHGDVRLAVLAGWDVVRVAQPGVDLVELRARPD